MDFFDKLGKKATEAYKITTDKTGKIAKETKLKLKMNQSKEQIKEIYEEIGRKVYEKHVREENISIKDELQEECTKIDVLSDEIEGILQEILNLKDKKQCPNCYKKINIEDNFCPNCGEKQNNKTVQEEEIMEDLENANVNNENNNEKEIVLEELKNDKKDNKKNNSECKEKSNLEKTVAIESDVEIEENDKEDE